MLVRLEPGELPGWAEPGTGAYGVGWKGVVDQARDRASAVPVGGASGPPEAPLATSLAGGGTAGVERSAARRLAASCSFSGSATGGPEDGGGECVTSVMAGARATAGGGRT